MSVTSEQQANLEKAKQINSTSFAEAVFDEALKFVKSKVPANDPNIGHFVLAYVTAKSQFITHDELTLRLENIEFAIRDGN